MPKAVWIVRSLLIVLLGYGLRKVGIPAMFRIHQLEPRSLHWQYPLFEMISLFCLTPFIYDTDNYVSIVVTVFMLALLVLAFIDVEYFILPDMITLPLLGMGLVGNAYLAWFVDGRVAVLSSLAAYLSLRLFADSYYYITGRIGMGMGDIKLLSALGAWFGFSALPFILWVASSLGLLCALLIFGLKRLSHHTCIPFGPFLVSGTWCYLVLMKFTLL